MISISKQKEDIGQILKQLDEKIVATFRYTADVMNEVSEEFNSFKELLKSKGMLNFGRYDRVLPNFNHLTSRTPIYLNNSYLVIHNYIQSIKSIDHLKARDDYCADMEFKLEYVLNKETHCFEIKIPTRTKITEISEHRLNIFRFLFQEDLSHDRLYYVMTQYNLLFTRIIKILVKNTIKDLKHMKNIRLSNKLAFQQKVDKFLSSLTNDGSLENKTELSEIAYDLLVNRLGVPLGSIKFYSRGMEESFDTLTSLPYMSPSDLSITREGVVEDGIFVPFRESIKNRFDNDGVFFSEYSEGVFKGVRFGTKSFDNEDKFNYHVRDYVIKLFKDFYGNKITKLTNFYLSHFRRKNIVLDIEVSDFLIVENSLFTTRSPKVDIRIIPFEQTLLKILAQLAIRYDFGMKEIFDPKQQATISVPNIETLEMFRVTSRAKEIKISFFDLVDYFIRLSEKVRDFFVQSLNLKAILQKKKFTEQYRYTSRGYLDIGKTITHSIQRGTITPMKTYRKELLEDPPILFLIYDSSGSMEKFNRYAQFLALLSLSFFNRDFKVINIGYIWSDLKFVGKYIDRDLPEEEQKPKKVALRAFPSDTKREEIALRRKYKFPVSKLAKKEGYEMEEDQYAGAVEVYGERYLGFLINDYTNFNLAFRDFLENPYSAITGTSIDIMNLIPNHPDMRLRGLKYVMVFTDHELMQADEDKRRREMNDFTNRSLDLIKIPDVRFFYVWITENFFRTAEGKEDSLVKMLEPDLTYRLPTRQYLMTKLKELITEKDPLKGGIRFKDFKRLTPLELAEINYHKFLFEKWDHCYIVDPNNMRYIGEIKNIIEKLERIKFFIP